MPYENARYVENSFFTITVVKLIDGFIGQVMFGEEIIFQSDLQTTVEEARKVGQEATIAAMKRLFS